MFPGKKTAFQWGDILRLDLGLALGWVKFGCMSQLSLGLGFELELGLGRVMQGDAYAYCGVRVSFNVRIRVI